MEAAANIIFRSISAIYEGTISSSSFYPNLYFKEINKRNHFYGFRLREIIPTRLIVNLYDEGKNLNVDMLWLVDDSKLQGKEIVSFTIKNSIIDIDCSTKVLMKTMEKDATLNACFNDLIALPESIERVIIGSKEKFSIKNGTTLKISNVPTELFAFSRIIFNPKKITNVDYQDTLINSIIALIDLIHRTLELIYGLEQKKSGDPVFCIRCGQKLPTDSFYCPICGTKQR